MKNYIRTIITAAIVINLLVPTIVLALGQTNADITAAGQDQAANNPSSGVSTLKDQLGDTIAPATPAEDPAAASARQDAECKAYTKTNPTYGKQELTCAEMKQADEAAALKVCTDAHYANCAEYDKAVQNSSGQGFKLNLDAFTLTSNGQKQGQAIFNNPNYDVKKYGPIVATLLTVIDILVKLIGSFAMLTLITAGIFMIANHGDEAWVTKGKGMMLYSILGILFALLSYALVNVIQSALA